MVVKIAISHLPINVLRLIANEIKIEMTLTENNTNEKLAVENETKPENNNLTDIILDNENNIHTVKQRLKDILIKNRIRDYAVITDPKEKNKLVILKKEHAEQL